ncbi:MAG: LCP family protein [Patescibacteria group bacterium]|jgi:anionic cell wall polymer biosynthesis LytR-Cps2A-Psr (LCP) family protein
MKFVLKFILGLVVIVAMILLMVYLFAPSRYNILVIGSDQRAEGLKEGDATVTRGRSDVLMVVSVPKSYKEKISIVMIPRDSKIDDDDYGVQKITHYYAMEERYESDTLGNLPLTQKKVETLLNKRMNATFEVTFSGFADIITLLDGVDTASGHLNADDAVELVRNRYSQKNGDFGRAAEQREIIKGAMIKIKQMSYAKKVYEYINTAPDARLKWDRAATYAFGLAFLMGHIGHLDIGEIEEVELPGQGMRYNGLYYWELDQEKVEEIVKEYL